MAESQIAVRVLPFLLAELNQYVEQNGISKTDGVASAIAKRAYGIATFLGCAEAVPLSQRMAELERRFAKLEALVKTK